MPWTNHYHGGLFQRWKILFQIAISRRVASRRHANTSILYLSSTRLVKYGRAVHLSEAAALLFLASCSPSIPVPKLHSAFRDDKSGVTYIVMERVDGQPLTDTWFAASPQEKARLLAQLRDVFARLRALEKPAGLAPGAVCAADGGKLHDYRVLNGGGQKGMGPFASEAEFHLFLRNGVASTDRIADPALKADLQQLIQMHHAYEQRSRGTVFSHGDVSLSNILAKDGNVVAIVDWEMSGWFPRYWEYTTAMNTTYIKGWREEIGSFLDALPREKEMDDLWRKHYCDAP